MTSCPRNYFKNNELFQKKFLVVSSIGRSMLVKSNSNFEFFCLITTEDTRTFMQYQTRNCVLISLHKMPKFHLIYWCKTFAEFWAIFPEIRWNYGILCSVLTEMFHIPHRSNNHHTVPFLNRLRHGKCKYGDGSSSKEGDSYPQRGFFPIPSQLIHC